MQWSHTPPGARCPAATTASGGGPITATFVERGPAASDCVPLWCGCCAADSPQAHRVVEWLGGSGLMQPGGLATTLAEGTGAQWDWPNAWPPLQHMAIEGLREYGGDGGERGAQRPLAPSPLGTSSTARAAMHLAGRCGRCCSRQALPPLPLPPAGRRAAEDLARRFLSGSLLAFRATGQMHEKYSCEVAGGVGGGGEYTPQVGFGWTNGVALDLLRHYRHTITVGESQLIM